MNRFLFPGAFPATACSALATCSPIPPQGPPCPVGLVLVVDDLVPAEPTTTSTSRDLTPGGGHAPIPRQRRPPGARPACAGVRDRAGGIPFRGTGDERLRP